MLRLRIALALLCWSSCNFAPHAAQLKSLSKRWTHYVLSVDSLSSDESLCKYDLHVERISRGVFGVSGRIRMDFSSDTMVEVRSYRSARSNLNYNVLPFAVPKQSVGALINGPYKRYMMDAMKECSTLPQFSGEFRLPSESQTYVLNGCRISPDKMPRYLEPGYYKIVVSAHGTVVWNVTLVVKVEMV